MNKQNKNQDVAKSDELNNKSNLKSGLSFPMGIWIWLTKEELHLWSETLYKITGVKPGTQPTFQLWLELVYREDLPLFLGHIDKLLNHSQPQSFVFRILLPDKKIKKVNCFAEILFSGSSEIVNIAFQCTEIKENNTPEQRIVTSGKKPEELQRKLLLLIVHDLRNSFNSVKGFSELLLSRLPKYDKQQISEYVDKIHTCTCMAYSMLENMLQWATIHTNGWNLVIEEVNLNNLVYEVIDQFKHSAYCKQVKILHQFPGDVITNTDKEALKIILRNLLSNAIKFSHRDGEILVVVQAHADNITFSIIDQGIGMTPVEIRKLNYSTVCHSKNGTEDEKGTGIGLSVCMELIEALETKLYFKSKKGGGTTVHFSLKKSSNN